MYFPPESIPITHHTHHYLSLKNLVWPFLAQGMDVARARCIHGPVVNNFAKISVRHTIFDAGLSLPVSGVPKPLLSGGYDG